MKKFITVALMVLVVLSLAACSSNDSLDYLVLVNKTHQLPDDWEDNLKLDTVQNSLGEELRIEHKTYEQFTKLREALLDEGVQIELDSVYRSVAEQQELWDE